MEVNDRIKNIGKYFALFNVQDGAVCVGVKFPDKWTLFDTETISNEFNVQIQTQDGTTFFLCDINEGFDPVFDAIDFIIDKNKELEEKTNLLKEKVDELRVLFEQESLGRLKTLRFKFEENDSLSNSDNITLPVDLKKEIGDRKKAKTEVVADDVKVKDVEAEKTKDKSVSLEDKKTKENKKTKQVGREKKNNNDSSLMSFVKNTLA